MSMDISSISPESIPAMSVLSAQQKTLEKAGTMMLSKTLDTQEQAGAALLDMMRRSMEHSVNPSVGGHIDISL